MPEAQTEIKNTYNVIKRDMFGTYQYVVIKDKDFCYPIAMITDEVCYPHCTAPAKDKFQAMIILRTPTEINIKNQWFPSLEQSIEFAESILNLNLKSAFENLTDETRKAREEEKKRIKC